MFKKIITEITNAYNNWRYKLPKRIEHERCIFCSAPNDDSDEHIIPQSINGSLHSTKIICSSCNNHFGRHIDPVIKENFNAFLHILEIGNPAGMTAEDVHGGEYTVSKEFSIKPKRPMVKETKIGNQTRIQVTGDPKNVKRMFEKLKAKYEAQGKKLVSESTTAVENSSPHVRIKWGINVEPRLIFLLNKIALEFYSLFKIPTGSMEDLCKKVRASDKSINNIVFCNFKNELRNFGNEEISHIVMIQSDYRTNRLYAYIEIFNVLCCIVLLDGNYRGKKVRLQYYQDAITRERFTKKIKLKTRLHKVFSNANRTNNFEYLSNVLGDRLRRRELFDVFQAGLKEISALLNEGLQKNEITKLQLKELYVNEAAKLFSYLTVFEFPYLTDSDMEEENDDYNYIHSNFKEDIVDDFIEQNKDALGKHVIIGGKPYVITSFYKQDKIVNGDKPLVGLYFVLVSAEDGDTKYYPVKTIIDRFVDEATKRGLI